MTARARLVQLGQRIIGGPGETTTAGRLLRPLALLYELASHVRATAYETGYLATTRLDRPVISVGNLTMGGTGKTPIVAMLAAFLSEQNYRVAVLTRGYGRLGHGRTVLRSDESTVQTGDEVGDEPALLAREVPGATIVVDADRVASGRWAVDSDRADVLILDDGYQHIRLARDVNLLVIDATDPFGGGYLPPSGRLREPLQAIRRADAVIVTRADRQFDADVISRVVNAARAGETPIYFAYHDITGLRPIGEPSAPRSLASLRGRPVAVLTAIGNPAVFVEDLGNVGLNVVSENVLPDHHRFTQTDVDKAVARAQAAGAEVLLTTEKDAVKLERLDVRAFPVHAVRIEFQSEHEALIKSLCLKAILNFRPDSGGTA